MLECKLNDTPVDARKKIEDGNPVEIDRYQRLVGNLIYLSHTRLDITFAVAKSSA